MAAEVRFSYTQMKTLQAIADGLTDAQIGTRLGRHERTIGTRVRTMRWKFDAANRAHLVSIAYQTGLLPWDGKGGCSVRFPEAWPA